MYIQHEILSAILSHQPKTELKKARLVCKAFDAAAVPFLFEDIYTIARYADMEKATSLALRFGLYVKTLILGSELYDFKAAVRETPKTPDIDLATCPRHFYLDLQREAQELLRGGEFYGHLCNTLARLPRLQKVILTNGKRLKGSLCWCQQAYVDGHLRAFNPFLDKNYELSRIELSQIDVNKTAARTQMPYDQQWP